jgi:hypothetical protein
MWQLDALANGQRNTLASCGDLVCKNYFLRAVLIDAKISQNSQENVDF